MTTAEIGEILAAIERGEPIAIDPRKLRYLLDMRVVAREWQYGTSRLVVTARGMLRIGFNR